MRFSLEASKFKLVVAAADLVVSLLGLHIP